MPLFADDDTRKAFQLAVRSIEMRSGVEILIAIRERSGLEPAAATRAGIVTGLIVLAVLIFAPVEFAHPWFLIDPIVFGGLAAFITFRLSALERLFTTEGERRQAVREAAAFTFFQRGLHQTRDGVGLLVYLGVRERVAVVLADHAVVAAVDGEAWREATAQIGDGLAQGESGRLLAARVSELGSVLSVVKRRPEDQDENLDQAVLT